jgi:hypothetical protein
MRGPDAQIQGRGWSELVRAGQGLITTQAVIFETSALEPNVTRRQRKKTPSACHRQPPTANRQPPTANHRPPTLRLASALVDWMPPRWVPVSTSSGSLFLSSTPSSAPSRVRADA